MTRLLKNLVTESLGESKTRESIPSYAKPCYNTDMNNKNIYIALVAVVVVVLGYWVIHTQNNQNLSPTASLAPENTATTSNLTAGGMKIQGSGGGTITLEPIPEGKAPTMPELYDAKIMMSNLSADVIEKITTGVKESITAIRKNSRDIGAWLNLGIYRKIGGDFTGARDVWTYVTKIIPTNDVAFGNLADLYDHFLKDPILAETNYRTAIKLAPANIGYYQSLADFYRYTLRDDIKARAILRQGISANPQTSANLKYLLDHYDEM